MNPLKWGWVWWLLGVLGLVAVTVLSLVALPEGLPTPPGKDLTLHLIAWALLAGWFAQLESRRWQVIALLLLVWSGGLELLQGLLSYRSAEWMDLLANAVGVVVGTALGRALGRRLLLQIEVRLGINSGATR